MPPPYAPECSRAMSVTASYVPWFAQSRCHSSMTCCQVTGIAPAWPIRSTAISWASLLVPPDASVTMYT